MERNLNNGDFERLLKQNADQYRMYPSEKVWNNIHSNLHTRRRWFLLGFALFLLSGSLVTYTIISESSIVTLPHNNTVAKTSPQQSNDNKTFADPSAFIKVPEIETGNGMSTVNNPLSLSSAPVLTESGNEIPSSTPEIENQDILNNFVSTDLSGEKSNTSLVESKSSTQPVEISYSDESTDQNGYYTGLMYSNNTPLHLSVPDKNIHISDDLPQSPWTIESVINSFKNRLRKKISFQLFFTPTTSYRKLSENKSFLRNSSAINTPANYAALIGNVNNEVTHKPDLGFELGVDGRYSLTKNLKIRAGIQFNVTRYDIKAFNYHAEQATITLNQGPRGVDSVSAWTSYRNDNGYKQDWLKNLYFQVSMPIGAEIKLLGNDKIQVGISSAIQPTYILGERSYLISSDYKNYARVPWLIRRWNVNTNVETYISYNTGKLKWQVGPQFRYQLLSSFKDKYPVKENLFDFGLKIGIGLSK